MATLVEIGQAAPSFTLSDLSGKAYTLEKAGGKLILLVFWSADCPWSQRADALIETWRREWGEDVAVWMIASNKNENREALDRAAAERELEVVLMDTDQQVVDLYGAVTTPHCFVVDREGILRYRGAIDDITFRKREASIFYLKEAVDALVAGEPVEQNDTLAFGCTIVRLDPTAS